MSDTRVKVEKPLSSSHLSKIDLLGGVLCLDFVNTVQNRLKNSLVDYLTSPDDWIAWLIRVEIITLPSTLKIDKIQIPVLIENRENIFNLLKSVITSQPVPKSLWTKVNTEIQKSFGEVILTSTTDKILSKWSFDTSDPMNYQYPIFKSLHDLLVSDKLNKVKLCTGCGWLFMDTSKNNSRKWCDMRLCGSQDKSKRYYQRKIKKSKIPEN